MNPLTFKKLKPIKLFQEFKEKSNQPERTSPCMNDIFFFHCKLNNLMIALACASISFFVLNHRVSAMDQNLSNSPDIALDFYLQVKLHIDLGQVDEADILLKSAKTRDKVSPFYHYYNGRVASMRFQNDEAIEFYTKATILYPSHALSYAAMALVKGRKGDFMQAIADLNKAIELDPTYAKAYANRGVTKGAIKDNEGAIRDFTNAINLDPRLANAYRNRGLSKEIIGDLTGACRDWKIAAALGQEGPRQWYSAQCK